MKFYFENEELKNVVAALKVVSNAKDAELKANLLLGAQDLGAKVKCGVRVTTQAEQIQYQFTGKKPAGFEVSKENIVDINVNAGKFIAFTEMALSYNSEVFFDVEGGQIIIGVDGRCKTPLNIEVAGTSPMKQGKLLYRFKITGANLSVLLKRGGGFGDDNSSQGLDKASILLMRSINMAVGYSTNGRMFGRAMVSADFDKEAEDERTKAMLAQMEKNLEEVTAANGKDKEKYLISIPKTVVGHIDNITSGQKGVYLVVDDSHLHVQVGNSLIYTVTLSATDIPVSAIDNALNVDAESQIGVDHATLLKGVEFINRVEDLSGNTNKYPIKVEAVDGDEGKMILSDDSGVDLESVVKPSKVLGDTKFAVSGQYLTQALAALTKGGVVIAVNSKMISLYNGTVENVGKDSTIGIIQVNTEANAAANASSEESDEASAE